jgi:anti-anti-sigma factor
MSHVSMKRLGTIAVLRPAGNLLGGDETDELSKQIQKLQKEGNRCLVVNLEEVKYMNSVAAGVLVSAGAEYQRRGASVVLCRASQRLKGCMQCGCWQSMSYCESEDEAIASFKGEGGDDSRR